MNSNKTKKGGRPLKSEDEKRAVRIAIYLNKKEYETLKIKAKSNNIKISECARLFISKGYINQKLTTEQMDCIRKISGMANNLNQLTREAHIYDFRYIAEKCVETCLDIDTLLNELKR